MGAALFALQACTLSTPDAAQPHHTIDIFQTTQAGDNLRQVEALNQEDAPSPTGQLVIHPSERHQNIYGFGASFTESSAWNLAAIPVAKRKEVLTQLFHPTLGAGFTLTRTHINSSDYSNKHYTYLDQGDTTLQSFSIDQDRQGFSGEENDQVRNIALEDSTYDLLPMILEAQQVEGAQFNIIASAWSPPSWLKEGETQTMTNGSLLPRYYGLWAKYLTRYLGAYRDAGAPIWALTPQNEPLHSHDARWDSNGFSNTQGRDFVKNHLGPALEESGLLHRTEGDSGVRILIYDHNKSVMNDYVAPTYNDPEASQYAWGTAVHWYANSELKENNHYAEQLTYHTEQWPDKVLIHSESSIDIDAEDPVGQYWRLSTDYAGTFVPFDTYANDIITDLNHGVQGYVEWCMILSHKGQPNPYDNFNSAPVLINPHTDEVIYTPLYYLLSHFSKFIRPGATRLGLSAQVPQGVVATAAENQDGTIAVVVFNANEQAQTLECTVQGLKHLIHLPARAMQTYTITPKPAP